MGYNTDTITFKLTEARQDFQFRCMITGSNGEVIYSDVVKALPAAVPPVVTQQPEDVEAPVDSMVTISLKAENAVKYRWQTSTNGGETFGYSSSSVYAGYNTDTITFKLTEARVGFKFRCEITGENGEKIYSDVVTVTAASTDVTLNDVVYEAVDGSMRVKSYLGSAATVIIPETVNDLTVTAIGEGAFENNTTLVSIDLPDSITVIGKRAFAGCTSLCVMN